MLQNFYWSRIRNNLNPDFDSVVVGWMVQVMSCHVSDTEPMVLRVTPRHMSHTLAAVAIWVVDLQAQYTNQQVVWMAPFSGIQGLQSIVVRHNNGISYGNSYGIMIIPNPLIPWLLIVFVHFLLSKRTQNHWLQMIILWRSSSKCVNLHEGLHKRLHHRQTYL